MSEVLLETVDLVKHFPLTQALADTFARREKDVIHAVDGVSLQLRARETLGLIGESGSGKTTLGWLAARLHDPAAGTLRFKGTDIPHLRARDLRAWRLALQVGC